MSISMIKIFIFWIVNFRKKTYFFKNFTSILSFMSNKLKSPKLFIFSKALIIFGWSSSNLFILLSLKKYIYSCDLIINELIIVYAN